MLIAFILYLVTAAFLVMWAVSIIQGLQSENTRLRTILEYKQKEIDKLHGNVVKLQDKYKHP
jgi:hypothetical protein